MRYHMWFILVKLFLTFKTAVFRFRDDSDNDTAPSIFFFRYFLEKTDEFRILINENI